MLLQVAKKRVRQKHYRPFLTPVEGNNRHRDHLCEWSGMM